jgi:hypothetical protein
LAASSALPWRRSRATRKPLPPWTWKWEGISSFERALDQLDGYLTLRDTHAGLIVFVRGKDVHGPVTEAEAFVASLPGAKKLKSADGGTDFRYRLKSTRYDERVVTLHVQFFHVRLEE